MKLKGIPIEAARKKPLANATPAEHSQFRSVVGSLSWIGRQARPDLSYEINRLQTKQSSPKVADLLQANKVVQRAQKDPSKGVVFRRNMLDYDTAVILSVNDASHGGEEGGASQSGRLVPSRQVHP